jgi:S1-C subfamily serine protease
VIREVNDSIAKAYNSGKMEGVFIQGVEEDAAVRKAGIKKGDIITAINGKTVSSPSQLQEEIIKFNPGDEVTVSYKRNGELKDVKVILRNRKGDTSIMKEQASTLGADFGPVSQRDMERLQIDGGVQVTDLKAGKLKDAGVKIGFIITDINKMAVSSKEDVDRAFNGASSKKPILIEGVYPNGEWSYYVLKPGQ